MAMITTLLTGIGVGNDISGPGSSTDNAIARWNGATGAILQDSSVLINDSDGITGATSIEISHTAAENDDHAVEIICNAGAFGDVKCFDIDYIAGAIAAGQDEAAILVNIDESLSTGGDIAALEILSTAEGSADVYGISGFVNVNPIIQSSGTFGNMDSALNKAVDVLAALVSGGAGNISGFVADNDTMTFGDAAKFEEMEIILGTGSSGSGIAPTFEYSTGTDTWATFSPIDGTNSFRNTGSIAWLAGDIPGWMTGTGTEFLIRITRTRNSLNTTPILDEVRIAATVEYSWNKTGDVSVKGLTLSDLTASRRVTTNGSKVLTSDNIEIYATGTLSNANLLGMYAAPVAILAAPGVGQALIVHRFFLQQEFSSAAFVNGGGIILQYSNTANGAGAQAADSFSAGILTASANHGQMQVGQTPSSLATVYDNIGIFISNQTAAFITGGGTGIYRIWYSIIAV